jgi:serralysin
MIFGNVDTVNGYSGDDVLLGGNKGDSFFGGDGIDYVTYFSAPGRVTADLNQPESNTAHAAGDTYSSIEGLIGTDFNDSLLGNGGVNYLVGGDGWDVLNGRGGADVMTGGGGNDTYNIDNIGDTVIEDAGTAGGSDTVQSAAISLNLALYANVEKARLLGSAALDVSADVNGTTNSTLFGNSGANHLTGGGGNDILKGGEGADVLTGGTGKDSLFGEAGADTFVFNAASDSPKAASDWIKDFSGVTEGGEGDQIDLSGLAASVGQSFAVQTDGLFHGGAGELRFAASGPNTTLQIDFNGDLTADFVVIIVGSHTMSAADLIL